jgi:hypothetical protein
MLKNNKNFYICFLLIFLIHQFIFQGNLIFNNTYVAEDYKSYIPWMIFGKIWFLKNGFLSIPHFAASLCGGTPYHADPSSFYFSFMQLFFIKFDVPTAIRLTFLTFSLFGFIGMYLLCNKSFKLNKISSLIAATLFIFNGFFTTRALVGHLIYGYNAFIPIYIFLIIESAKAKNKLANIYTLVSGLLLCSFFYAGASSFMLFALYSIILILVIHWWLFQLTGLLKRTFYSLALTCLLSLSKISYSLNFLKLFPREIAGATLDNYLSFAYTFISSLFIVPDPFFFDKHQYQINKMYIYLHELEYGVGIVPILIFFYFIFFLKKKLLFPKKNNYLIIILLLLPSFLIVEIPYLSDIINQTPVISSTWVRSRWLSVYIIPIILGTCILINKINFKNNFFIIIILLIPILQNIVYIAAKKAFFPQKSYEAKAVYSFDSINKFSNKLNHTTLEKVKIMFVKNDQNFTRMDINEGFVINTSDVFCYSPIFGYNLEKLPRNKIINKDERYYKNLGIRDNKYNLFKPMCLLFPKENNCQIGDVYSANDERELTNFINYHPVNFKVSYLQKIFDFISVITLISTIILIIVNFIIHKKKLN